MLFVFKPVSSNDNLEFWAQVNFPFFGFVTSFIPIHSSHSILYLQDWVTEVNACVLRHQEYGRLLAERMRIKETELSDKKTQKSRAKQRQNYQHELIGKFFDTSVSIYLSIYLSIHLISPIPCC